MLDDCYSSLTITAVQNFTFREFDLSFQVNNRRCFYAHHEPFSIFIFATQVAVTSSPQECV